MNEITKFNIQKKKLEGICDENDLVFNFNQSTYPISLTIKPCAGCEAQQMMLEGVEENGYRSPDAQIVLSMLDGDLTYTMSEAFSIGDALFSKIRNIFKKMHALWVMHVFRTVAGNPTLASMIPVDAASDTDADDAFPVEAEPLEDFDDEEDMEGEDEFEDE